MTLLRRRTPAPEDRSAGPAALRLARGGGDDAGAFLDLLARLLRLPPAQSAAIREEIDGHLRERVRDLMIAGRSEPEAVRGAIEELGDAAALASRFRAAARTPLRRKAMNFAILGVAGAALVTSIVAVNDGERGPQRSSVYQPSSPAAPPAADGPISLDAADTPLSQVLAALGKAIGARAVVRWPALEELGADPDHPVTLHLVDAGVAWAFEALNEEVFANETERPIQYRLRGGVLEVATVDYFDRRETTLVRYDIGDILDAGVEVDEFSGLVMQFVEPELWVDNGGDKAEMSIVAGKAFLKAPPRVHDGVLWFIEQLGGNEDAKAGVRVMPPGGIPLELRPSLTAAPGLIDHGYNLFALSHTTPDEVIAALERDYPGLGLTYSADPRRNQVIARGPAEARARLTSILPAIDRPPGDPPDAAPADSP